MPNFEINNEQLPEHRRYREPTFDEKLRLYEFYKLIYTSNFSPAKKRSVMTAVLAYETWSWRVVGITEDAVKEIARNNFNKPVRKLARDHKLPRSVTYGRIFDGELMSFDSWWEYVWENDKTILMTNDEHRAIHIKQPKRIYPVNPADSLFVDGKLVGWYQTQAREGSFIRWLCESENIVL